MRKLEAADMSQKDGLKIARASMMDVHEIGLLAHRISEVGGVAEKINNGFIIPYSSADYEKFVRCADYFFVAYSGAKLIGFVLAHSGDKTSELGGEVYEYINNVLKDEHVVVRQICVDPELSRKGYGRMLYNHVFDLAKKSFDGRGSAVCFIWKKPLNRESEKFHGAMGWTEVETYTLRNGNGQVGIWELTLRSA